MLASPRAHFVGTFAKRAAEATAPLLVAMDQLKEVARAQELAERAALLDEALHGGDPGSLAIRAAVFGIDFTAPVRVVHRARLRLDGARTCARATSRSCRAT